MNTNELTFDCIRNGCPVDLPFQDAHIALWKSNIGWVRHIEWLRFTIDGHEGIRHVDQVITAAGRFFGAQVLKRGNTVLSIGRYARLLEREGIEANLFHAHAYRFNKAFFDLPDAIRPIAFVRLVNHTVYGVPGYRLRPPLQGFIINGVSPRMKTPSEDVDWSPFTEPPVMEA